MGKKQEKVCYTFDVTRYKMQSNGIPEFKYSKEVYIEATNYIAAIFKLEKHYPSDKYVTQLSKTSNGSWPEGRTLWPRFDRKVMLDLE